jgi:predicted DCC family thiol-disulfide oxidoreductase YuxK
MNRPILYPLTVFYDASCPMCASEMHALKARDALGRLELVDCSAADFDETVLAGTCIRREELMALIHARDAHGRWFVGVDVFAIAYRIAGLETLAGVWGSRKLRPALVRIYPWIAKNRQLLSRLGVYSLVRLLLPVPCRRHHRPCECIGRVAQNSDAV